MVPTGPTAAMQRRHESRYDRRPDAPAQMGGDDPRRVDTVFETPGHRPGNRDERQRRDSCLENLGHDSGEHVDTSILEEMHEPSCGSVVFEWGHQSNATREQALCSRAQRRRALVAEPSPGREVARETDHVFICSRSPRQNCAAGVETSGPLLPAAEIVDLLLGEGLQPASEM